MISRPRAVAFELPARCVRRQLRSPAISYEAPRSIGTGPARPYPRRSTTPNVAAWGIDALTLAGHKLYAPKGIGALYLRSGHAIPSVLDGAGQEGGRRPGTENVPYIVGLGQACRMACERLAGDATRIAALKERLWQALAGGVPELKRLGGSHTLPNTLSVLFPGTVGNDLLEATPAIAASTGSACHAGSSKPSAVILALGISPDRALGAVRLSLGRGSSDADIDSAAAALIEGYWTLAGQNTKPAPSGKAIPGKVSRLDSKLSQSGAVPFGRD